MRGVKIIGCIRSCDRSSNLCRVEKSSNVTLSFSSSSSSSSCSSFFSFLLHPFKDRLHHYSATLSLSCACRDYEWSVAAFWFNRFKCPTPCPPRFYRSSERDVFYRSTRSSSQSLSRFFYAHIYQSCSSLVLTTTDHIIVLRIRDTIKSFFASPVFKRTVLVYYSIRNPYFCRQ